MLPSSPPAAAAYTAAQLKQMRAQCIVFLAFKNQQQPRKLHLEIALDGCVPPGHGEGDGETSSSSQASYSYAVELPPPHLLPISELRLSPRGHRRPRRRGVSPRHEDHAPAPHDE
ncbi:uncharacterized protein LOC100824930 [Brachypodium distachyon]|uniref:Uncharacterized protein n=1 Tax=Brachypodium distachyon TaxID=15368 RepID=A0A0Q3H444_BRADI|nr:uncharacterized protein LOC100824930 [Brachypodium distachyon]KQJ88210.1 hypothetical protein BRADI_4g16420v3 [Brachypodium distachyon]|eukprot:XP_003575965.1 uncharacterized protein LOC100824930 [Brachypodium distachyon]